MKSAQSSFEDAKGIEEGPKTIGFITINGSTGTQSVATAAARYWADHASRPMTFIGLSHPASAQPGECPSVDRDVLIDLGRLRPSSSGLSLAAGCDLLVVSASPEIADLVTLLARLPFYRRIAPVEIVLVGAGPFPVDELRRLTGIDDIHVVPLQPIAGQFDEVAVRERRRIWSKAVRRMTTHLVATTSNATPADLAMRDWAIAHHPSARLIDVAG